MSASTLHCLPTKLITSDNFRPFGQVIDATSDAKAYDAEDAQLQLQSGMPRFYIMRLPYRGRQFHTITRHQKCTQCLGSLAGQEWLIAVAPPGAASYPAIADLRAFQIPGTCFIKLDVGTWHAGPYFDQTWVDFYNLELSDTNITDHETVNLKERAGVTCEIGC